MEVADSKRPHSAAPAGPRDKSATGRVLPREAELRYSTIGRPVRVAAPIPAPDRRCFSAETPRCATWEEVSPECSSKPLPGPARAARILRIPTVVDGAALSSSPAAWMTRGAIASLPRMRCTTNPYASSRRRWMPSQIAARASLRRAPRFIGGRPPVRGISHMFRPPIRGGREADPPPDLDAATSPDIVRA